MVLVPLDEGFLAQVHKVAANFNLVSGVKIAPMKNNQKAVVWFCRDFSEDEVTGLDEQLSAKFATPQQAEEFMDLANSIVEALPSEYIFPLIVAEIYVYYDTCCRVWKYSQEG